jgi:hypothetical protein
MTDVCSARMNEEHATLLYELVSDIVSGRLFTGTSDSRIYPTIVKGCKEVIENYLGAITYPSKDSMYDAECSEVVLSEGDEDIVDFFLCFDDIPSDLVVRCTFKKNDTWKCQMYGIFVR